MFVEPTRLAGFVDHRSGGNDEHTRMVQRPCSYRVRLDLDHRHHDGRRGLVGRSFYSVVSLSALLAMAPAF